MIPYRIMFLFVVALFLVGCVHTQKNTERQENTEAEAITGSHIRSKRAHERVGNVTKSGVRVIEAEELEQTGEADLGRAIKKSFPVRGDVRRIDTRQMSNNYDYRRFCNRVLQCLSASCAVPLVCGTLSLRFVYGPVRDKIHLPQHVDDQDVGLLNQALSVFGYTWACDNPYVAQLGQGLSWLTHSANKIARLGDGRRRKKDDCKPAIDFLHTNPLFGFVNQIQCPNRTNLGATSTSLAVLLRQRLSIKRSNDGRHSTMHEVQYGMSDFMIANIHTFSAQDAMVGIEAQVLSTYVDG